MNFELINFAIPEATGLVRVIYWLITASTSIALGVILFTIILKLITFPFDFYSRMSMRKNSYLMEKMRPELEKLQKQYANDKALYNQKMMALYKKNGYSMWGSCLPTIVTLVIFIVAINAFSTYSQFQNKQYFYDMSLSYNSVIYDGFDADGDYVKYDKDTKIFIIEKEKILNDTITLNPELDKEILLSEEKGIYVKYSGTVNTENQVEYNKLSVYNYNSYVVYEVDIEKQSNGYTFGTEKYFINEEGLALNDTLKNDNGENYSSAKLVNAELTAKDFVLDVARNRSRDTFREENQKFLWIQNIFMPDNANSHAIYETWDKFETNQRYENGTSGTMDKDKYNELIYKLDVEKTQPNGYYVLVILTALSSFLMQIVSNKAQKAQLELQTVDGQGAQSQKIMKWMMPIMMAVFAFMYTAAFSIYIILSSVISLLLTLLTNVIVNKKYGKLERESATEPIRGRVYVKKEEPKEEKKKKVKKEDKIDDHDFLSGKADKHPRGRLK